MSTEKISGQVEIKLMVTPPGGEPREVVLVGQIVDAVEQPALSDEPTQEITP
jgi:hypothetical protein